MERRRKGMELVSYSGFLKKNENFLKKVENFPLLPPIWTKITMLVYSPG
jgi:hypothetical protein